jgi:hypothetical protein
MTAMNFTGTLRSSDRPRRPSPRLDPTTSGPPEDDIPGAQTLIRHTGG